MVYMKRVLVVGGGASGTMVAVNLIRNLTQPIEIWLAEPEIKLGRGIAYRTTDPNHLLNVPAGRMSIFEDDPKHLCNWLEVGEGEFIPRRDFGLYLENVLNHYLTKNSNVTFKHYQQLVTDIQKQDNKFYCSFDNDSAEYFDLVVLALGHQQTIIPKELESFKHDSRVIVDVWQQKIDTSQNNVAIIGTGLTFYDVALSYLAANPEAKIYGISRNGLLPSPHLRHREPPLPVPNVAKTSAQAMRDYLVQSGEKWREAQDGIRHDLQEIWADFPDTEKRNFFDKYFRWWNVLRHRSAPEIDERIKEFIANGSIEIISGSISQITSSIESLILTLDTGVELLVDQVINCCGNGFELSNPLLLTLTKTGLAKTGPLNLGIAVDTKTLQVKNSAGQIVSGLFAIGPILVGELLETTAIPEIKTQAAQIARQLISA